MSTPRVVRVLCVDDNQDLADTTAYLLGMCGYEARACYNGPAALAAVDGGFIPDVCLIDLTMPGMDGDELAPRLRARLPGRNPLLVAMTAMATEGAMRRTLDAGFDHHFVKPVDPDRLLAVMARLDG